MEYIGLTGSGNDYELEIVRDTQKAYLVKSWNNSEVWLPKKAFDETGTLTKWGYKIFLENMEAQI